MRKRVSREPQAHTLPDNLLTRLFDIIKTQFAKSKLEHPTGEHARLPAVAPSRGRGLKHANRALAKNIDCRPFTGAWIETFAGAITLGLTFGRPFTGAWIETTRSARNGCPDSSRPFTGAWIETIPETVAVLRIRRPFTGAWIET